MSPTEPASRAQPTKLYRYRPPRPREIDTALGRGQLFFAAPSKLRDPYEGRPELLPADEEAIRAWLLAREAPIAPGDRKRQASLRAKVRRRLGSAVFLEKVFREATEGTGVCALSATRTDPLLWAHRADRHRGFCLEFDVSDPQTMPIGPAQRVLYAEERPRIAPLGLAELSPDELLRLALRSKPAHWAYEREWRLFSTEGAGKRAFPRRLLRAVYLGGAATPRTRNAVLRKLAAWEPADRPKVFAMTLSGPGFELEPVEVDA